LIRDLNDDLWANPINPEFEAFVSAVRDLIMPIFEAVEKHGLKKRNLGKFKKAVERFYEKTICDRVYESEVTCTYQKRFDRYRESLFVFLGEDNIPWNNNMAERAIKELAALRRRSTKQIFRRRKNKVKLGRKALLTPDTMVADQPGFDFKTPSKNSCSAVFPSSHSRS